MVFSILLGILPEALFYTFFIDCCKEIKGIRFKLFIVILIEYIFLSITFKYSAWTYVLLMIMIYLNLVVLNKQNVKEIIDLFIILVAYIYLCIVSIICFSFVSQDFSNYYIILFINRGMLLIPMIFRKKINIIYKKYKSLWNINKEINAPIKSLTIRNISLVLLNMFIFLTYCVCIYINSM